MTIKMLIDSYNFHDIRAFDFRLIDNNLEIKLENNSYYKELVPFEKNGVVRLKFFNIQNFPENISLNEINEYLLNIYIDKTNPKRVELVFDNNNFTSLSFCSENAEFITK